MFDHSVKLDRREFLKALAAAGATTVVLTSVGTGPVLAQGSTPAVEMPIAEYTAELPGNAYGRAVALATAGPMNNPNWKAGDAANFVPPDTLIKGKYIDAFAKVDKAKLLDMYKKMLLMRKWSTTAKDLYVDPKGGLYGDFHLHIGQEASTAGVIGALNPDDYVQSNHRGHNHVIGKGLDLNAWTAEICCSSAGLSKGNGHEMHVFDLSKGFLGTNGIVGSPWLTAMGAGYAAKVNGKKQVAVAFGGEGACQSIYYFNSLQIAATYNIPYIAVIENNFYSSGGITAKVSATKYQAELTKGLGISSITVDGNDIAAVYSATKEAVDRARTNSTPSVIECITYRWYDHSGFAGAKPGVDGAFGLPYRTDAEVRAWMARDPIPRMGKWLVDQKIATDAELKQIDADATKQVADAWTFGRAAPKCKPEQGLANVWGYGNVEATQFFDRKGTAVTWVAPEYVKQLSNKLVLEA
jgi:acetoin:2,6-dichlorophenolindophenol oxidoreductase subunit alpha